MTAQTEITDIAAFFRNLSDEELLAYRASEDYRDRILADEEFSRRTTPAWLKALRGVVRLIVGLVIHPGILVGLGVGAFTAANSLARTLSQFGLVIWAFAYILLMLAEHRYRQPVLLWLAVGLYAMAAVACAISIAIVLSPFVAPR